MSFKFLPGGFLGKRITPAKNNCVQVTEIDNDEKGIFFIYIVVGRFLPVAQAFPDTEFTNEAYYL